MITKLILNVDAVVDEVLAETALRRHLGTDDMPVLSRDRREAVVLMVHASFARMCMRMMGCVVDCSCGCDSSYDDGDNLMSVDIEHEPTASALMWTHALQHSLAMDVLGEALCGVDGRAAQMYCSRSRELENGVMRDVARSGVNSARITGHMF